MLNKKLRAQVTQALVVVSFSASLFVPLTAHAEDSKTWDRGGVSLGIGTTADLTSQVGNHEVTLEGQNRGVREFGDGKTSSLFHRHARVGTLMPVASYLTTGAESPAAGTPPGVSVGISGQFGADYTLTSSEEAERKEKGRSIKPALYLGMDSHLRASLFDVFGPGQLKQLNAALSGSVGPALTVRIDPAKLRLIVAAFIQGGARMVGTQIGDFTNSGGLIPGVKTGMVGLEIGGKIILVLDDRLIVTAKGTTSLVAAEIPGLAKQATVGEASAIVRVVGPMIVEARGKIQNFTGERTDSSGFPVTTNDTVAEGHAFVGVAF